MFTIVLTSFKCGLNRFRTGFRVCVRLCVRSLTSFSVASNTPGTVVHNAHNRSFVHSSVRSPCPAFFYFLELMPWKRINMPAIINFPMAFSFHISFRHPFRSRCLFVYFLFQGGYLGGTTTRHNIKIHKYSVAYSMRQFILHVITERLFITWSTLKCNALSITLMATNNDERQICVRRWKRKTSNFANKFENIIFMRKWKTLSNNHSLGEARLPHGRAGPMSIFCTTSKCNDYKEHTIWIRSWILFFMSTTLNDQWLSRR